ncbi:MAG TPA: RsmD family RNA methyltransferase [Candidatus Paceibacterota bacterium]|nr:RsmD family RNA methyltransferase [Candidatus Paceibacterota bacterium]
MKRIDSNTNGWNDYELIDSGAGRKLERFGNITLDRPDPQVLWQKTNEAFWHDADASFSWAEKGERWKERSKFPDSWIVRYGAVAFNLSLKQLKHVGLFPEHEPQWRAVAALCKKEQGLRLLNLFGYTGATSLVAANAGAQVTHVDASKQAISILKENIAQSKIPQGSIRTVCEDAIKYAKRLIRREEQFEIIVMDPPAFGRGPKGEVWKIEERLAELVALLPPLLSSNAHLILLNGYAAGYSARTFAQLLERTLDNRGGEITYGDVGIVQRGGTSVLTTGIYSSWQR